MANILYEKLIRQKSTNGGLTWVDLEPKVFKVGDIIENPSNCKSDDTRQCRWTAYPDTTYRCEETEKYQLLFEECTEDGKVWVKTGRERKGDLIEVDSIDCGGEGINGDLIVDQCPNVKFLDKYLYFPAIGGSAAHFSVNNADYDFPLKKIAQVNIKKDLGIDVITEFSILMDGIYEIIKLPDLSKSETFIRGESVEKANFENSNIKANQGGLTLAFYYALNTVDVSPFNVRGCDLKDFFLHNYHLTRIYGLENFDTSETNDFRHMFAFCVNLKHLELSNFRFKTKIEPSEIFAHCYSIEYIDMRNWGTIKGLSFEDCLSLKKIDMSGTNVHGSSNIGFRNCFSLEYIIANDVDETTINWIISGLEEVSDLDEKYFIKDSDKTPLIDKVKIYSNTGIKGTISGMPPIEPISFWHVKGTICEGVNKYELLYEEESTDGGYTWSITGREKRGKLIEVNCSDCGYVFQKTDVLEFTFTGDSTTYFVNGVEYTATTSPYRVDFRKDLGIEGEYRYTLSWNYDHPGTFPNNEITKVTALPSGGKYIEAPLPNATEINFGEVAKQFVFTPPFFGIEKSEKLEKIEMDMLSTYYSEEGFGICPLWKIEKLDLSKLNFQHSRDKSVNFNGYSALKELDITNWDIWDVDKLAIFTNSLNGCTSLRKVIYRGCSDAQLRVLMFSLRHSQIPDGQVTIIR